MGESEEVMGKKTPHFKGFIAQRCISRGKGRWGEGEGREGGRWEKGEKGGGVVVRGGERIKYVGVSLRDVGK